MPSSAPVIPVFASGDIIESSWANDLRDYHLLVDGRTGGDPGTAGLILGSVSSLAGAWNTVIAWLGFTPVNKAGDSGIGALTASALASTGNVSATGTVSAGVFNGGSTASGAVSALGGAFGASGISSTGTIAGASATFSGSVSVTGNVSAGTYSGGSTASGSISAQGFAAGSAGISSTGTIAGGAITASSLAASGTVSAGTFSGGTTAGGSISAQGVAAGSSGISSAGQITSSVATGTAPLSVSSTTVCPNLHADNTDKMGGVAASGWARIDSGTYSGTGTNGRTITTAITPKLVIVTRDDGVTYFVTSTGTTQILPAAVAGSPGAVSNYTDTVVSNGFTVSASGGTNISSPAHTYIWVMFS